MQEQNQVCLHCKAKNAKYRCSICKIAYYCGIVHQELDWKDHQTKCRPWNLVDSSRFGKHYVARRNIKFGETVMEDKAPLITVPDYMRAKFSEEEICVMELKCPPVCLNCYVELTEDNVKLCDKCDWPLCLDCTEHGIECEFTQKHGRPELNICPKKYGEPHPAYVIIGIIRALALRENDPLSYLKLMAHRDSFELKSAKYDKYFSMTEKSFGDAARLAKSMFEIDDTEEAEICKIMRIIWINHTAVVPLQPPRSAVYDASSYIEQNCCANCAISFNDEGGLTVWAAVPISKGDHITVCYPYSLMHSSLRKNYLRVKKFIECQCKRCEDPTEFGTMYSRLLCPSSSKKGDECDGCILPPTFLITQGNYPYCVCSKCSKTTSWTSLHAVEEIIWAHWGRLDVQNFPETEKFFERWKDFLPVHNFFLVDVKIGIIRRILDTCCDTKFIGITDKFLVSLAGSCSILLNLIKKIAPTATRTRGVLLCLRLGIKIQLYEKGKSPRKGMKEVWQKERTAILKELYTLVHREPACFDLERRMAGNVLAALNAPSKDLAQIEEELSDCSI